ncbi:hypothetical protein DDB_G0281325 [Dictyostelium discoideum AX4]|uniref:Renin receptor N-terminal domain-containing protein n=1 Tax=Dictyostelium discoideum TaxID=44689 RepID=Q54U95_DICDI|nr:hypothetical protein DDB_G0281325 [Dictyostelium discoideum AX4]EAL66959.1 hypothetical protein DDB_G0281325 [Dictyostelium discoideum AX4]|eukprot:XP_640881.1 hypothetical protein DDB_G0281325 [Dictyostelium discoideum AX4]
MKVVLFVLMAIIAVSFAATNFVDHRSGHIVIKPTESQNSKLFLKGSAFDKVSLKNINDVQVSNIITHVMGLLPLNNEEVSGLPAASIFNKPKLNLFFSVESVSSDDLVNSKIFNSESMISIEKTFTPQDLISELTTIVTGVTPNVHGIVSSNWINPTTGHKVHAYEKSTQSSAANIAYLANASFNGKSMIISSSADKKSASATGIHTGVSSLYKDADIYTYSVRPSGSVLPIFGSNGNDKLSLTNNQVETIIYSKEFQQFILPAGWKATFSRGIFTIVDEKGNVNKIDFDQHETGSFLTELVSVFNIVKTIKTNEHFKALAADSIPDFISFDFASISRVRESQGANSDAFKFALALVEQTIQSTITQLSGVYGDRVACEIVALAPKHAFTEEQIEKLESIVGEHTHDITETLPHIYVLPESSEKVDDICQQIQSSIPSELSAQCFIHTLPVSFLQDASGSAPAPTQTPVPSDSDSSASGENPIIATQNTNRIAAFQIFLFFPIVFALFIGGGILYIMKISFTAQSDTLLYRSSQRQY